MCGIGGLFSYNGVPRSCDQSGLRQLSMALRQRGPDAAGAWNSDDHLVHLVHRRLAIIDISPASNQPMVDMESGCVLVFNGEIYNYSGLRDELISLGHRFYTTSDSEVLLRGYLEWDEALLPRLRGMFAFALWDPSKRSLLLARDPYGIKPLYFCDQGGRVAFASQVKALQASFCLASSPEPAAVVGLMLMGSVPDPFTIYQDILALPAGHSLWVNGRGAGVPRSFSSVVDIWVEAAMNPQPLSDESLLSLVRSAVADSVRVHQVGDVPIGAFLSAGIDSGSLVGLLAMGRSSELQTHTLVFSRFRNGPADESLLAEQVAAQYGCKHTTHVISDIQAIDDLPQALVAMDQPSVDGFNTWLICKYAAAHGLKVVISGIGGDELFGGYDHFTSLPRWEQSLQLLSALPGALTLLSTSLRLGSRLRLVNTKAAALCRLGPGLAGLYLVRRGLFMPWELPALLDPDLVRQGLSSLQPPAFLEAGLSAIGTNPHARIAVLESTNYLRNQLLRDSDWASMNHSLELRTPLVDIQLLRDLAPALAAPRASCMKLKHALAHAPDCPLPRALLNRPKSGFSLPMGHWLEHSTILNHWRQVPSLKHPRCHWARRMAYSLAVDLVSC
jgi:asparagine synthase (glutamine-hydrolysing)